MKGNLFHVVSPQGVFYISTGKKNRGAGRDAYHHDVYSHSSLWKGADQAVYTKSLLVFLNEHASRLINTKRGNKRSLVLQALTQPPAPNAIQCICLVHGEMPG